MNNGNRRLRPLAYPMIVKTAPPTSPVNGTSNVQ